MHCAYFTPSLCVPDGPGAADPPPHAATLARKKAAPIHFHVVMLDF
jgi:hypothetical protein